MNRQHLQHRETLLLEALLSSLDARESAKEAGAPMLLYLSELFVKRAREELEDIRRAIETRGQSVTNNGGTNSGATHGDAANDGATNGNAA